MSSDAKMTSTRATIRLERGARTLEGSRAADLVTTAAGLGAEFALQLTRWHRSSLVTVGEIKDEYAVHALAGHHPIGGDCRRQRGPRDGSEKTGRPGAGHGIGPGRRIQFAVDALEMGFERVHRDEKLACDLSGG